LTEQEGNLYYSNVAREPGINSEHYEVYEGDGSSDESSEFV